MQRFDRVTLLLSYIILVLSVGFIGWVVEHNANQTQARVCSALEAQIKVNVELTLYARALKEDKPLEELRPTLVGRQIAKDLRNFYTEVCDAPLD